MNEIKINSFSNFSEIIQKLVQSKGVSEEKIKSVICQSFCQFYKQKLNREVDFHFEFGDNFSVYRLYQIVEKVNDSEKEIASSNPQLKEGKKENNTFYLHLKTEDFSSGLVSEVKKMIQQGLSWENQFKLLQKLQEEETLIGGELTGIKGDYYLVNINLEKGKVIGYWEKKEWTSTTKKPYVGQSLSFLIKQVNEKLTLDQPSLLLTRESDNFYLKVLKREVPEVKEGIVIVRQILRSPESIKVVVESKKKGVSAVGACMGIGSDRIRSISHALVPGRIDIVPWFKEKRNLESIQKPSEKMGSYKNIQLRTSEDTSEEKNRPWTKKFNVNK